jgi:hypothetical protein
MKKVVSILAVLCLAFVAALPAHSQNLNQLLQGSQMHLTLQNDLTTKVAHAGDPFTAIITEPVFVNSQLVLPAGTKITGVVGAVIHTKWIAMFRGQAAMNLTFKTIEIDHRDVPVQMSIIAIQSPQMQGTAKARKDVKVDEGEVIQEKNDIKNDILTIAIGTSGGTVVGAVFSHAMRGFAFGFAGTAAYVVARKGKDVELPPQTGLLVRLDNTLTLPTVTATAAVVTTGSNNQ